MNTFSQAAALVPIVKIQPSLCFHNRQVDAEPGKRLPLILCRRAPRNRQSSSIWEGDPQHVICYEGLRKDLYHGNHFEPFQGLLSDEGPYAIGDR